MKQAKTTIKLNMLLISVFFSFLLSNTFAKLQLKESTIFKIDSVPTNDMWTKLFTKPRGNSCTAAVKYAPRRKITSRADQEKAKTLKNSA